MAGPGNAVLVSIFFFALQCAATPQINNTASTQWVSALSSRVLTMYGLDLQQAASEIHVILNAESVLGYSCAIDNQNVAVSESDIDYITNVFTVSGLDLSNCFGYVYASLQYSIFTNQPRAVATIVAMNETIKRPMNPGNNQTLLFEGNFPSSNPNDYSITFTSVDSGCTVPLAYQASTDALGNRTLVVRSGHVITIANVDLSGCSLTVRASLAFRGQGAQPPRVIGTFVYIYQTNETSRISPVSDSLVTIYGANFLSPDPFDYQVLFPTTDGCGVRILSFYPIALSPTALVVRCNLDGGQCHDTLPVRLFYPASQPVEFPITNVAAFVELVTAPTFSVLAAYHSSAIITLQGRNFLTTAGTDYQVFFRGSTAGSPCTLASRASATAHIDTQRSTVAVQGVDLRGCRGNLRAILNYQSQGNQTIRVVGTIVQFDMNDTSAAQVVSPVSLVTLTLNSSAAFSSAVLSDYVVYFAVVPPSACPASVLSALRARGYVPSAVTVPILLTLSFDALTAPLDLTGCNNALLTASVGFRTYGNSTAQNVASVVNACAVNGACVDHALCTPTHPGGNRTCGCNDGYAGDGYTVCTAASCAGFPSVANAINGGCTPSTPLTTGQTCNLQCASGYHRQNGTSYAVECRPNLRQPTSAYFSDLQCPQSTCVLGTLNAGQLAGTCTAAQTLGETCELECRAAWAKDASTSYTASCDAVMGGEGTTAYTTDLVCIQSICDPLTSLPAGLANVDCPATATQTAGQSCSVACAADYVNNGGQAATFCASLAPPQQNLVGYNVTLVCAAPCAVPSEGALAGSHAGRGTCATLLRTGETCGFVCRSGYSSVGSLQASCVAPPASAVSSLQFALACSDVNECGANNGGCDAHALCSNYGGGFFCVCKHGYKGNGVTCTEGDDSVSVSAFDLTLVLPDYYVSTDPALAVLVDMLPFVLYRALFDVAHHPDSTVTAVDRIVVLGATVESMGAAAPSCAGGNQAFSSIVVAMGIEGQAPSAQWIQNAINQYSNNCTRVGLLSALLRNENDTVGIVNSATAPQTVTLERCRDGQYRPQGTCPGTGSSSDDHTLAIVLGIVLPLLFILLLVVLCYRRRNKGARAQLVPQDDAGLKPLSKKMCRECKAHPAADASDLCVSCAVEKQHLAQANTDEDV